MVPSRSGEAWSEHRIKEQSRPSRYGFGAFGRYTGDIAAFGNALHSEPIRTQFSHDLGRLCLQLGQEIITVAADVWLGVLRY